MSLHIPGASPPANAMAHRTEIARRPIPTPADIPATPLPAVQVPPAAPESAAAYGEAATEPLVTPDQTQLTAERVRQEVLARPPQASGIHGNLVAATVLNLLV